MPYFVEVHSPFLNISMDIAASGESVGDGVNISLTNNPQTVAGMVGNGLHFDGINQYIDLGTHAGRCVGDIELCTQGFTMAMWIRPNDDKDPFSILVTNGVFWLNGRGLSIFLRPSNEGPLYNKV